MLSAILGAPLFSFLGFFVEADFVVGANLAPLVVFRKFMALNNVTHGAHI